MKFELISGLLMSEFGGQPCRVGIRGKRRVAKAFEGLGLALLKNTEMSVER